MIKWVVISLLFLIAPNIFGQSLKQIHLEACELYYKANYEKALDILEKPTLDYIKSGAEDSLACEALFLVSRLHSNVFSFKKSHELAFQVRDLCEKVNYKKLWIESISIIIALSEFYLDYENVFKHANLFIQDKDVPLRFKSDAYSALSSLYQYKERLDSSIFYGLKATKIDSISQDSSSIPYSYFDLGATYANNYQYDIALKKMLYGRSFIPKKDRFKIADIDIRIASIFYFIGNINKAKSLTESALELSKKMGLEVSKVKAYILLGHCENYNQNFEKAFEFYHKADSLNNLKIKNPVRSTQSKVGMANAKLNLGIQLSESEIEELRKIRSTATKGLQQNNLDFLFLRLEDNSIEEFERKYDKYFKESIEGKAEHLSKRLLVLKKEFYRKKGAYEKAMLIDYEIDEIEKNISQKNNEYIIQELDSKYKKKIQDKEIAYLANQNKNKSKIVTQQRITIFIGSITLIIGAILLTILFKLFKKVDRQKNVISNALSDKNLLIREIHHRVKNNLQLVSSLLTLQSRDIDDEKAKSAIQDGKSRVRSMALIHQDLYMKDSLMEISVKDYLEKLTSDLFLTYKIDEKNINLNLDIDDVDLDIDTLVPLGLIINELITNSLKYAFKENKSGILGVSLKEKNKEIELIISDNGIGFDTEKVRDDSFGTTMIKALSRQLNAKITSDSSNGTKTILILNI